MQGTQDQALKIIGLLKGIKAEELASIMMVPTKYTDEICQSLLKDELIIKSAGRDGFALKCEVTNEVTRLIRSLRIVYAEEISKRLAIPLELAKYVCEVLLEEGLLHKTRLGGYLLKENREAVLKAIKELKTATAKEISKKLDFAPKYVEVLCKSLMEDYLILKKCAGRFIPVEKDVTRLLRLVAEFGWTPINRIVHKMKITQAYAELLCRSLAEKGYLKKAHPQAYALAGRKDG